MPPTVLMLLAGAGVSCFTDARGVWCARAVGAGESGRTRVAVSAGGRHFEAEVDDGVIVEADGAPPPLEGARYERTLFSAASLHLYRALDGDSVTTSARLASQVGSGGVRGISPDLWLARRVAAFPADTPSDPRFGGQWYLDTIRARAAWLRSVGDPSIEIAVIDDGCDLAHADLAPQLLPGRDVVDRDDDPSFTPGERGNGHGTACAGLIAAATDNAHAISGVCPRCRLRCVKLIAPAGAMVPISADADAFAFALSSGVDIASNSWGFGPSVPAPGPLVTAIRTAITRGRDGKGMVVVFASGNDDGVIGADQVAAIEGVIAVGSVNLFDELTPYSNRGPALALVAPAGTLTLDPTGAEGEDPGDVTDSFGGTSSACPIVAGVVGLMLARQPELTATQVKETLMRTARRAPFARPDDAGHDDRYGHGIVDAAAALAALEPPVTLPVATAEGPASCGCGPGLGSAVLLCAALLWRSRRAPAAGGDAVRRTRARLVWRRPAGAAPLRSDGFGRRADAAALEETCPEAGAAPRRRSPP